MQPSQIPQSPVPTSQRPINGAVAGGGALLVNEIAKIVLATSLPPDLAALAPVAAPLAGMATSAVMATVGDVARSQIVERPPQSFVGKLLLGLLARIG